MAVRESGDDYTPLLYIWRRDQGINAGKYLCSSKCTISLVERDAGFFLLPYFSPCSDEINLVVKKNGKKRLYPENSAFGTTRL